MRRRRWSTSSCHIAHVALQQFGSVADDRLCRPAAMIVACVRVRLPFESECSVASRMVSCVASIAQSFRLKFSGRVQISLGSLDENIGIANQIAQAMNNGLDEAGAQLLKQTFVQKVRATDLD